MEAEERTYEVDRQGDTFTVISPTGVNVLDCRNEHSARHYAVLLSTAWRAGYREGFRAAGSAGE